MSIYTEAIKFYISADTFYRVHSPYLLDLVQSILDDRQFYCFQEIEHQRRELLQSKKDMKMIDLGAGSRNGNNSTKRIKDVAQSSLSSPWQCQVIFKLAEKTIPSKIIEIGSSLGISTAYLSRSNSKAAIYSLEGNSESITIAKNISRRLQNKNVEFIEGNFDETLLKLVNRLATIDLAFVDGNHRKEATLNYFNILKNKINENSILVFDDIYWSSGMKEAWNLVKADSSVTASLDFFYFGMIFFDQRFKEPVHLKIIPSKFKPWQKFY